MRKRLTNFTIIIALVLAGIYLLQHHQWLPSFANLFKSKSADIEKTAIVVREINNLAQLVTISAYNEVVVDSTKQGKPLVNPMLPVMLHLPVISAPDERLVLIGKGTILAGVDLAKLQASDIYVKDDSVFIRLPAAEILQVIINPSGFETFEESGHWSDDEVKEVKYKLREKLVANSVQQNLLPKATARAVLIVQIFLSNTGFAKVKVQ